MEIQLTARTSRARTTPVLIDEVRIFPVAVTVEGDEGGVTLVPLPGEGRAGGFLPDVQLMLPSAIRGGERAK